MTIGLFSLPFELLVLIVGHLDDVDSLLALRGACRNLRLISDLDEVWKPRIGSLNSVSEALGRKKDWHKFYKALGGAEIFGWGRITSAWPYCNSILPAHLETFFDKGYMAVPLPLRWSNLATECMEHLREAAKSDYHHKEAVIAEGMPAGCIGIPIQICANNCGTVVLTSQGRLLAYGLEYVWPRGPNQRGQLEIPREPKLLDTCGQKVCSISASHMHLAGLLLDGSIMSWAQSDRLHPVSIKPFEDQTPRKILQLVTGTNFTAILTKVPDSVASEQDERYEVTLWMDSWTVLLLQEHLASESASAESTPTLDCGFVTLPPLPDKIVQIAAGSGYMLAMTECCDIFIIPIFYDQHFEDMSWYEEHSPGISHSVDEVKGLIIKSQTFYIKEVEIGNMAWTRLDVFSNTIRSQYTVNEWTCIGPGSGDFNKLSTPHISAEDTTFAFIAPTAIVENENGHGKGIVLTGYCDYEHPLNQIGYIDYPSLQGKEIIKIVGDSRMEAALTLQGQVLTWPILDEGARGDWDSLPLDTDQLDTQFTSQSMLDQASHPIWGPAFDVEAMTDAEKLRYKNRAKLPPLEIEFPTARPIRFGFPRLQEIRNEKAVRADDTFETKFALDICVGWHSAYAITLDRQLLEDKE
jgi:hypothetical protein